MFDFPTDAKIDTTIKATIRKPKPKNNLFLTFMFLKNAILIYSFIFHSQPIFASILHSYLKSNPKFQKFLFLFYYTYCHLPMYPNYHTNKSMIIYNEILRAAKAVCIRAWLLRQQVHNQGVFKRFWEITPMAAPTS